METVTLVSIALATCILLLVCLYLWRISRPCVELDCFDSMVGGNDGEGLGVCTRLSFEASMACKEKYGELRYNNANRLVVGDFVREYLRTRYPDLRVVDRVKHASYAVELALVPTRFSLAAQRFSQNPCVVKRRTEVAPPK